MSDQPDTTLTNAVRDGRDHKELKPNGQQLAYVVLTEEERAKGFVRPLRRSYKHVGIQPMHSTRPLTSDEATRYAAFGYVSFEAYPDSEDPVSGRFWTQAHLDSGCGTVTTMSREIAETYASNPKFYGGTFCAGCGKHLPLEEFVWDGTTETVGS